MNIAAHIANIKQSILPAQLLVVSKNRSISQLQKVYDTGVRSMAENRVQSLLERVAQLPADIEWHLIGHLQSNKVKYIAPFIACIHSVDSIKLLETINQEATKNNRIIRVLLQVKVAEEESKFGLNPSDLIALCNKPLLATFEHIAFCGLMAMASFTDSEEQVASEFALAKKLFDTVKPAMGTNFTELSMGMSGDYALAIKHGSTMVRIGTAVFEY